MRLGETAPSREDFARADAPVVPVVRRAPPRPTAIGADDTS